MADVYTIEATGRVLDTRRGQQPEFRLLRNGTCVATGTRQSCERDMAGWQRGGNPLRGIGGELRA